MYYLLLIVLSMSNVLENKKLNDKVQDYKYINYLANICQIHSRITISHGLP